MARPWSRHPKPPPERPRAGAVPMEVLEVQTEQPEPIRVLERPERPMGYVEASWISPVARQFLHPRLYPRLSPYFEHREYAISWRPDPAPRSSPWPRPRSACTC